MNYRIPKTGSVTVHVPKNPMTGTFDSSRHQGRLVCLPEHDLAEYLRDQGWTVEPPRRVTPESRAERGDPLVFSPAYRVISVSRCGIDATLDLTVDQALLVAEQLIDWADYYDEYQ